MRKLKKSGFTLIELLVVISIVSLLASIIAASLSATRAKAQTARRIQDIGEVNKALALYAANNNGAYPIANGLTNTVCWECGLSGYYNANDHLNDVTDYLKVRPTDPLLSPGGRFAANDDRGYWYKSDGIDYKFTNVTDGAQAEYIPPIFRDLIFRSNRTSISVVSSSRAANWTSSCTITAGGCNEPAPPPPEPESFVVTLDVSDSITVDYDVYRDTGGGLALIASESGLETSPITINVQTGDYVTIGLDEDAYFNLNGSIIEPRRSYLSIDDIRQNYTVTIYTGP